MQTTSQTASAAERFQSVIGRSKSGDQLHLCTTTTSADGRTVYGGCNAHCNNHMHLRPVSTMPGGKATIKMRPGLFCRKCFGTNEALIVAREYFNAIVVVS